MLNYFVVQRGNIKKIICVVMAITLILDVCFSEQPIKILLIQYCYTLLTCVLAFFSLYFILWVQVKIAIATEKMLNFAVLFFIVFSIILFVLFFFNFCFSYRNIESLNIAFMSMALLLSAIRLQCKREDVKF